MDDIYQGEKCTKQMREQAIRSIGQYQQYLNMALGNQNRESEQLQFYIKMVSNQHNKMQMDMIKIYDYLQQKNQYDIKDIVQHLMRLSKQAKQILKINSGSKQKQVTKIRNQQYCNGCKSSIQRMNINIVKEQYGITEGQDIEFKPEGGKVDIRQCLKDDGYLERQKMHIDNLDFHINQLVRLMEKQFLSKTSIFLGRDDQIFRKKQMELTEESAIMKQNERQYHEIQQFKSKFNQNFFKHLRLPIQQTVNKILKNMEKAKKNRDKQRLKQSGMQTVYSTENQVNVNLQCEIVDLKSQIKKLKTVKMENEKNIMKYLQNQNQLKKQLVTLQQENIILEQKFKHNHQKSSAIESKMIYQNNNKTKQIAKLQKLIIQLKQKMHELQKVRIQGGEQSKQTMASIKEKRLQQSRKSIQKMSKKNIKPRPSLDYSVNLQETQICNTTNHARFQIIRKHTSYIRNAKIGMENNAKILQNREEINDTQECTLSKISSSHIMQKQQKLKIYRQVSLTLIPQKSVLRQSQIQNIKQRSLFNKKVKTLRHFKINKKQHINQTHNILNRTFNQSVGSNKFNLMNYKQGVSLQGERSVINERIIENRIKTQQSETTRHQMRGIYKQNRSIQRLKTGAVVVRQLKNKNQQEIQKQSSNLSQIKGQHLLLFGGDKYAAQFEKGGGIWPHLVLVDKLVVDLENLNLSTQIYKYFKYLQQNNPSKFVEYLSFLSQPLSFLQAKKKDQRLDTAQINSLGIKDLFVRLIRFHKIIHRNCSHIRQFLESIGFKQC